MTRGKTSEDKITEYTLDGEPIKLQKKRGRPRIIRNPEYIPQDKKIEACALYTVLGDFKMVAEKTGLTVAQLKKYKDEPWWAEVQKKIMVEQNEGILAKINGTVELALQALEDRVINGDLVKVGETMTKEGDMAPVMTRQPVKARDLSQIFHALTHQRNLMRGDPTQITTSTTTDERLKLLQQKFEELGKGTVLDGSCKDVTDG